MLDLLPRVLQCSTYTVSSSCARILADALFGNPRCAFPKSGGFNGMAQPACASRIFMAWSLQCPDEEPVRPLEDFVKTRIQSLSFLATLAIALLCWGSALNAQNTPSTTPDRQAQQPSSSPDATPSQSTPRTQTPSNQNQSNQTPDSQQAPDQAPPASSRTPESGAQQPPSGSSADSGAASGTQTFSGTVVKQGDKYVLKDDSGHTYDIDHQDEVKKFEGKRVRVQGTLDPATNKIMVK